MATQPKRPLPISKPSASYMQQPVNRFELFVGLAATVITIVFFLRIVTPPALPAVGISPEADKRVTALESQMHELLAVKELSARNAATVENLEAKQNAQQQAPRRR